jgi:hypothetical protein
MRVPHPQKLVQKEYPILLTSTVHLAHRTFRNWPMTGSLFSHAVKTMRLMLFPLACLMGVTMDSMSSPEAGCCPVLELRQYTLKAGQREVLIDLFDRHFVEPQEAAGMTLAGQFRDRRRPDRFVWLRGFSNMESRHKALDAFYGGPVWAAHKATANNTMEDVSDVLLLKPARPELAFHLAGRTETPSHDRGPSTVVAGSIKCPGPSTHGSSRDSSSGSRRFCARIA